MAYGPEEIASISYLISNDAAYCITSEENLISDLEEIIEKNSLRESIVKNAVELAHKNHDADTNSQLVRNVISNSVFMKNQ